MIPIIIAAALPMAVMGLGLLKLGVKAIAITNPILVEVLSVLKSGAGALLARAEKAETALVSLGETELTEFKAEVAALFAQAAPASSAPATPAVAPVVAKPAVAPVDPITQAPTAH